MKRGCNVGGAPETRLQRRWGSYGSIFAGPQREVAFAVTSPPNGTGVAEIASSYVEVEVRYRREAEPAP